MTVTQNYPVELGRTSWINSSAHIIQQGNMPPTNGGLTPATQSVGSVVYVGRVEAPHMPPSWKVA